MKKKNAYENPAFKKKYEMPKYLPESIVTWQVELQDVFLWVCGVEGFFFK